MSDRAKRILVILAIVAAVALLVGGGTVGVKKLVKATSSKEAGRLAGLLPHVRDKLQELRRRLEAQGIPTLVGQTIRDADEQAAIVVKGASTTQQSWHRLGRAVDLYPIVNGEPDLDGKHTEVFRTMAKEAVKLGFQTLAFHTSDWSVRYLVRSNGTKFWDGGHLQWTDGLTWSAAASDYSKRTGVKVA